MAVCCDNARNFVGSIKIPYELFALANKCLRTEMQAFNIIRNKNDPSAIKIKTATALPTQTIARSPQWIAPEPVSWNSHCGFSIHATCAENDPAIIPKAIPKNSENRQFYICDPMLATGGSATAAVNELKKRGISKITLVCIIAAPEGVKKFHSIHPEVPVYAAGLDEKLNKHGYILPGLGDAGDRMFGTK